MCTPTRRLGGQGHDRGFTSNRHRIPVNTSHGWPRKTPQVVHHSLPIEGDAECPPAPPIRLETIIGGLKRVAGIFMRFYTLRRIVWLFNALQRNLTDFFTACWLWHKPGTSPAWLYDSARGDWTHVLHSADCSPPICRDITVCIGFIVRLYIRVGIQNLCQREGKCLCRVAGTYGLAIAASARATGGPVTRYGNFQTWGCYPIDNIR